jgi:predicted ATPase/transcriptional regulator with XRE-family HTH domain
MSGMPQTQDQGAAFGPLLRRYRVAADLTQEALAERAGVSVRTVSDLERGINRSPRKDTLPLLEAALGLAAAERSRLDAAAQRLTSATRAAPALPPPSGLPLVGRDREVAAVERHLAGEGPPVLLLAGEPGIGKSRLVQEAGARAAPAGWTVLAGGCHRRGGQDPYAPLVETLEAHLQPLAAAPLRAALHGCAWLVRLLPELAAGPIEALPAWTVAPEQERRLLFRAVGRFLANVAGPAGTLLLLDDLQWAGPDALDLLASVVRAAAGSSPSLRVVGAYRDSEVQGQHPLALLLSDLGRAGLATRRLLAPLPPSEAAQLLAGLLPEGSAEQGEVWAQVVQRTGGVPFYLVSYAQRLRTREPESGGEEGAPWDVAQSIRQRVAALPESARDVLGVAAVLGREVPPLLLVAAAARTEEDVVAALEAACQGQLLVEDARGTHFAHDIIREVVEADLGAARRRLLHRRVAAAIEALHAQRLPEYYELLAHHYTEAGLVAEAAPRWLQAGQRAAQRSAYREAISHLAKGLALVPLLPDTPARPQQELDVQVALGQALLVLRGYTAPEVGQAYNRARELCRQVGASAQLVPVLRGLWGFYVVRGASQTARELAGEILAAAEGQDDEEQLLVAQYICGHTRLWIGELAAARAHLEDCLARYETWDDAQLNLSPTLTFWLDSGVTSRGYLAWLLWLQGKADEALTRHDASLQLAQRRSHPYSLAYGLVLAAFVRQCRGDVQAALDEADMGIALATEQGFPLWLAWGQVVRGWALAALGDTEQGVALLREGIAARRATGAELAVPYFLYLLGDACARAGRTDAALAAVAEGLTVADTTDQHLFSAELHRLRGELLRDQDVGTAEDSLAQALAVARGQGAHALELRAAMSLGRLWHDQGKSAEAHALVAESYGWFTEGFATADLQAARALLTELARAPAAPSGGRA